MNAINSRSDDKLRQAVEVFWETFPPFWHLVRAHIRQTAADQFGLSVEQFHILRHIRRGDSSISDLAQSKNISRPAMSQAVNALVNKGLITRLTDARDRRHIRLELTEAGNALLDAVFEDTRQWMMQLLASLNDEELQTLISALVFLRKTQSL